MSFTPRNIPLYNALMRAFGNVGVSKIGEPAQVRFLPRTFCRARRDPEIEVISGGEEYCVSCPYCGDIKQHLSFSHIWCTNVRQGDMFGNPGTFPVQCWRKRCTAEPGIKRDLVERVKLDPAETETVDAGAFSQQAWEETVITLPPSIPINSPAVPLEVQAYMRQRGERPQYLYDYWGVHVGLVRKYQQTPSLIFPIFQNGVLRSYQARYGIADSTPDGTGKYDFMPGTHKKWLLYNIDSAKLFPIVVLVEGVFDAIRVGPPAVAMFGKKPSDWQVKRISEIWNAGCLVWLPDMNDPASIEVADNLTNEWNIRKAFAGGAHSIHLPANDPGSCKREVIWSLISERTGVRMPSVCTIG